MADEKKPSLPLGQTGIEAAVKAVLQTSNPTSTEEKSALTLLAEALAEREKTGQSDALTKILESLRTDAQKKAAETNEVDFALANAWFAQHWEEPRNCPICKKVTWGIAPTFSQNPVSRLGLHMPPRTNPCVAVICRTCGYTLYFNALIMGQLARSSSEKE
jgi:hypothetical protein